MRLRTCDYNTVICGDGFKVMQNRKHLYFIVMDIEKRRYARTDDCILEIKNNPDNYDWKQLK